MNLENRKLVEKYFFEVRLFQICFYGSLIGILLELINNDFVVVHPWLLLFYLVVMGSVWIWVQRFGTASRIKKMYLYITC